MFSCRTHLPEEREATRAKLVSYYSGEDFPYVKSLFDEQRSKHVKVLQGQLMLREQKRVASYQHMRLEDVKTPIGLAELFKDRSVHPDKLPPSSPANTLDRGSSDRKDDPE